MFILEQINFIVVRKKFVNGKLNFETDVDDHLETLNPFGQEVQIEHFKNSIIYYVLSFYDFRRNTFQLSYISSWNSKIHC